MHHPDLTPSKRFHGVYYDEDKDEWLAFVCDDTKEIECGHFLDEEDAARSYDACAQELQEEPKLNFPEDEE